MGRGQEGPAILNGHSGWSVRVVPLNGGGWLWFGWYDGLELCRSPTTFADRGRAMASGNRFLELLRPELMEED